MILLIIGVGMLNFLLPAHLNSIMFLLILCVGRFAYIIQSYFKFHYVSINSYITVKSTVQGENALNSIMFLLILTSLTF